MITGIDPWVNLVGQQKVRERLTAAVDNMVHAYLFLGSPGSGTMQGALGFAALILSDEADNPEEAERAVKLAVAGTHPDVVVIESQGSALRVSEADEIAKASMRTPVEGSRKVIVVPNIDVIEPAAIGKLLKVIEEPPPSTVFVLLGQEVAPEFITIASRCVTIEFGPLSVNEISTVLQNENPQAGTARIELAGTASGGDLDRARLLLTDEALHARSQLWASVPSTLDGRGTTTAGLVNDIRDAIEKSLEPLAAKQQTELEELAEWVERFGERGSGRAELVARHKREARRLRTDELRFGFAILARHYRDAAVSTGGAEVFALNAIQNAAENLVRNPNEVLLLQNLFITVQRTSAR